MSDPIAPEKVGSNGGTEASGDLFPDERDTETSQAVHVDDYVPRYGASSIRRPEKLPPDYEDPLTPRSDFPMEAFPPPIRDVLADVRYHQGFMEEGGALVVLVSTARLLTPTVRIRVTKAWTECPALWAVVSGATGASKTSTMRRLTYPHKEVARAETEIGEEYNVYVGSLIQKHKEEVESNTYTNVEPAEGEDKREAKARARRMAKLEFAKRKAELEACKAPIFRFSTQDATTQALERDMCVNMGDLLFYNPDGSGVLESVMGRMYENADPSTLMRAFDGDPIETSRVGEGKDRRSKRSGLSLMIMSQPDSIRELAGDESMGERGFLSRLLCFVHPEPGDDPEQLTTEREAESDLDGTYDGDAWRGYTRIIAKLCTYIIQPQGLPDYAKIVGAEMEPEPTVPWGPDDLHEVRLTQGALRLLFQFERRWKVLQHPEHAPSPDAGRYLNKYSGLAVRVALVLHVLWCGECEADWTSVPIPEERIRDAIELLRFYFGHVLPFMSASREAQTVAETMQASDAMEAKVLAFIRDTLLSEALQKDRDAVMRGAAITVYRTGKASLKRGFYSGSGSYEKKTALDEACEVMQGLHQARAGVSPLQRDRSQYGPWLVQLELLDPDLAEESKRRKAEDSEARREAREEAHRAHNRKARESKQRVCEELKKRQAAKEEAK